MEGRYAGDREWRARKSPQDVDAVVGHGPFLVDGKVSGTGARSVFRGGCQADMGDSCLSGCRVMDSLGPRDAPGRCMKSEQRTWHTADIDIAAAPSMAEYLVSCLRSDRAADTTYTPKPALHLLRAVH
jgi:hypothetical protein